MFHSIVQRKLSLALQFVPRIECWEIVLQPKDNEYRTKYSTFAEAWETSLNRSGISEANCTEKRSNCLYCLSKWVKNKQNRYFLHLLECAFKDYDYIPDLLLAKQ